MTRNTPTSPPVRRLLTRAARQWGAFSVGQALILGVTHHQVQWLLRHGIVRRRRRGLYVIAGSPACPEQATVLALLAAPDGAVASHETAAHLHQLLPAPSEVHITVGPNERVRMPNVVAHRSPLPSNHRATVGAIPVTSLHRTVVDLASVMELDAFADVLDPLMIQERIRPERLLSTLDDIVVAPGRHGTTVLRHALDVWLRPIEPESPAEARLLRKLIERGHDGFETQYEVVVGGRRRRFDIAWPVERCALEYAGALAHGPRHWGSDEPRMAALKAEGWAVREVDALDVVPSKPALWSWLDSHLRRAA